MRVPGRAEKAGGAPQEVIEEAVVEQEEDDTVEAPTVCGRTLASPEPLCPPWEVTIMSWDPRSKAYVARRRRAPPGAEE